MADTETFDSVHDWVADRRAKRDEASEETLVDEAETIEEDAPEEVEAIEEEISEADPAEEDIESEPEEASADDDVEEVEELEPETPAVEPPQFWDAEGKAAFARLPKEVQNSILNNEQQRESAVSQKVREAAETRKQLDQRLESLGEFVTETEEKLTFYGNVNWAAEYAKATTQEEIANVEAHEKTFKDLQQKLTQAKTAQGEIETEELKTHVSEQSEALTQLAATNTAAQALLDPQEGSQRKQKLGTYLKAQGIDDDTLTWITAEATVLGYKAMLYDEAQEKARKGIGPLQTQKPSGKKVVRPAGQPGRGSSTSARLKTLQSKAELSPTEFKEKRRLERARTRKAG
ncbi:MAG: hypothetical protein AAGK02_04665 [Pseudomonadota bacterium]